MNGASAFEAALQSGLQGIELDVQLTADSVLVAHHDASIAAGAGCAGRVNDLSWLELSACASPDGPEGSFRGVRVDNLLKRSAALHPQAEFTLDVKLNTAREWWLYLHAVARAIARLEALPELHGRIVVECRTADLLKALAEHAPDLPTYLCVDDAEGAEKEALALGCEGITVALDKITGTQAASVRSMGLKLTLFGVGDTWALRRAAALHPDRIQLDQ